MFFVGLVYRRRFYLVAGVADLLRDRNLLWSFEKDMLNESGCAYVQSERMSTEEKRLHTITISVWCSAVCGL
jgi:hypothetical protein